MERQEGARPWQSTARPVPATRNRPRQARSGSRTTATRSASGTSGSSRWADSPRSFPGRRSHRATYGLSARTYRLPGRRQRVPVPRRGAQVRARRKRRLTPLAWRMPRPAHPEPFTPQADPAVLEDLRARLRATRWPDRPEDAGWSLTDVAYLRESSPTGRTASTGRHRRRPRPAPPFPRAARWSGIHFVHARAVASSGPVLPLVLSHGWPDSFWRYLRSSPCVRPRSAGADPANAFDVVVPDLPGYGLRRLHRSPSRLHRRRRSVGDSWASSATAFSASGGDIGSHVSRYLALDHPDRVVTVHRQTPAFPCSPATVGPRTRGRAWLEDVSAWSGSEAPTPPCRPYEASDRCRRFSTSSPAGLASWIVEKLPSVEQLRRGRRAERPFRRDPPPISALLAHQDDQLVDAHVPGRRRRSPPRYVFRGPARGPLASGPGMTVSPCEVDDLGGGVTGPGRCRRRR